METAEAHMGKPGKPVLLCSAESIYNDERAARPMMKPWESVSSEELALWERIADGGILSTHFCGEEHVSQDESRTTCICGWKGDAVRNRLTQSLMNEWFRHMAEAETSADGLARPLYRGSPIWGIRRKATP